ncbi:hypothetical protein C8J57DRAFT_1656892 [Mycena rebaudengoi]|nr:hypothetical protein C8J57DRAFT_1656892 [Mycena rebaudengoi]
MVYERPCFSIPSVVLLSGYFARKWYLTRRRLHGIGKGAPGFQTNVRKIRVPPELMARIRRGDDVSPHEIVAASARMDAEKRDGPISPQDISSEPKKKETKPPEKEPPSEPVNEWLPENIAGPKKRSKGKKK